MRRAILSILLAIPMLLPAQNSVRFTITGGDITQELRTKIESNLGALFTSINTAAMSVDNELTLPRKALTGDAAETIMEMWEISPFECDLYAIKERLIKTNMGYEVRNIPVTMITDEADIDHREEMLLVQLNNKGVIENLTIALNAMSYRSILANTDGVELAQRQMIVNFIENFRTAYNRRDIDYIQDIYSDNALIITGRKLKPSGQINLENPMNNLANRYEYVRQSKKDYIERLKGAFRNNEYINIEFSDIEIRKHPKKDNLYGVTLIQKWNSTNYKDEGVLFLVVDFFDELRPLIQVRTWQEMEDVMENGAFTFDKIKL